jgi:hypothetical protein
VPCAAKATPGSPGLVAKLIWPPIKRYWHVLCVVGKLNCRGRLKKVKEDEIVKDFGEFLRKSGNV